MIDKERVQWLTRELLIAIGEDPERSGLRDTPNRVAKWWQEFVDYQPGTMDTVFGIENVDEMVVVSGMRVWSLCEHHLLPFHGKAHVAYLPRHGHVVGLSKLARTVEVFARRPQLQERLTDQIADALVTHLDPEGAIVIVEGEHMCMKMRGVRSTDSVMTTIARRGVYRHDEAKGRHAVYYVLAARSRG